MAIAQLDAICDEYASAIAAGDETISDDPQTLRRWTEKVSPELQSWLQDELIALQRELAADGCVAAIPHDVDEQLWHAVNDSDTFRALSNEAKAALAASILRCEFQSGEMLLRSGQQASALYLITEGSVSVLGGDGGQRYEIDTDGVGAVLGEMSMITGYPCSADVVAETPIRALALPLKAFEQLRDEHPEVEIALSQLVSDRLGQQRRDALCGKVLGGYRLRQRLGIGAMGVVYEATQESDHTGRAVKMLRHRFIYDPRVISRFDQEAELLKRLQHPNIVAFHEHFVAYRTRFIVLELFDGADLRTVIRHHGPMSEPMARAVLGQIAAGLRYAHQHGVLHLDLKPANILVDRNGRVAITDFGLSQLVASDTGDQECVGTPQYMPPEQFLMSDIGPHCDWYSFGCIAYELVSGRRLFQAGDSARFIDGKLRPVSQVWPQELGGSDDFHTSLHSSLEPRADLRDLDLEKIATWSRLVPELAETLNDDSQLDCEVP